MATFPWSSFPSIITLRLYLREIVRDDADDVYLLRSDADVQRYNSRPMRSVIEAQALISTMQHWYRSVQAVQWGITIGDDNRVVGICGLHDWKPNHQRAMIGYDLAREHWGQGFASEAIREVLQLGFEQLSLHQIQAETIVENVRSVRLLERLGFTREGVRREHSLEDDGEYHGTAMYGLLRADYRHLTRLHDEPSNAGPTFAMTDENRRELP